jgi:hypothetical protein
MEDFDVEGARAAGYTDAEIADYLASQTDFDAAAARAAGYADAEIVQHLRSIKVAPEPDRSFEQNVGVITSALSPYATAATLGAAAGAPFAGVGALPGAAGGVLSLGLADLGTGIYNAAAPLFDGQRVSLPSETIRAGYENVGIGRRPQTPEQEVLLRTIEGGAGALGGATAFANLAARQAPGLTRNIMQQLAQHRGAQTAAGAGAAAAPTIAREYAGVTNPVALMGLSLLGGMTTGALATPRPRSVTSAQLNAQAKAAYDRAEQAGVLFDPTSVANLGGTIRQSFTANPRVQFDPVLHPRINRVLQRIDEVANEAAQNGASIPFSQVELLRRVARTAANSMDKDERRLGYDLIRQIDAFVEAPPRGAVVAGQAPEAATALKEARTAWRRMSQADALDTMVDRARRTDKPFSLALRDKAKQVADNPNRMRGFDKDIQREIDSLARGQGVIGATGKVGHLSPSFDIRNMRFGNVLAGGAGGAFYSGEPTVGAIGLGLGGAGMASRAVSNRMASNRMAAITNRARGTPEKRIPAAQIAAQSMLPAVNLPSLAPEGQVLVYYGTDPVTGAEYPVYGPAEEYGNDIRVTDYGEPGADRTFRNFDYDEYGNVIRLSDYDEQGNYIGPR